MNKEFVKLPIAEVVIDSFTFSFMNLKSLIRASVIWILIMYAIVLLPLILPIFGFYEFKDLLLLQEENTHLLPQSAIKWLILYNVTYFVVFLMAYYAVSVAWHRSALLEEKPPLLRFGKLELKYIWVSFKLLFVLLPAMLLALMFIVVALNSGSIISAIIFSICGYLCIMYIAQRLVLSLVLASLGKESKLNRSWKMTKDNGNRLLGAALLHALSGLIVTMILFGAVALIIYLLIMFKSTFLSIVALITVVVLFPFLQVLSGSFIVNFWSFCYMHLKDNADIEFKPDLAKNVDPRFAN